MFFSQSVFYFFNYTPLIPMITCYLTLIQLANKLKSYFKLTSKVQTDIKG